MRKRAIHPAIVSLAILVAVVKTGTAQAQFTEYEVKASLIVTLANLTSWPENAFDTDPNSTFVIGILGDDPFGLIMEDIVRGRQVNKKRIVVKRASSVEELKGAHIIFISRSESNDIRRILAEIRQYKQASVLTFGDNIQEFNQYGGIINFIEGSNIRYTLNWTEANERGLNLRKQILNIADKIISSYDKK